MSWRLESPDGVHHCSWELVALHVLLLVDSMLTLLLLILLRQNGYCAVAEHHGHRLLLHVYSATAGREDGARQIRPRRYVLQ